MNKNLPEKVNNGVFHKIRVFFSKLFAEKEKKTKIVAENLISESLTSEDVKNENITGESLISESVKSRNITSENLTAEKLKSENLNKNSNFLNDIKVDDKKLEAFSLQKKIERNDISVSSLNNKQLDEIIQLYKGQIELKKQKLAQ